MKIGAPWLLLLLPLVPAAALLALWNHRRGRKSLILLTGRAPGDDFFGHHLVVTFFSTGFFCAFLFFAILAAADFSWGRKTVEEDRSGLDLVFLLDVSRSMLAPDAPPNRLRAAVDAARGVMQGLPEARFGIVAFKGRGVPVVPVTEDHGALESFFAHAGSGVVAEPGTRLDSGLEAALAAFPSGSRRHRAVVLLSDGESQGVFTDGGVSRYAQEGIPVFAVGFGGKEGSTIRLPDGSLIMGRNRRPVVTRLEEKTLRAAAEISGGAYLSGREPGLAGKLVDRIQGFAESRGLSGFRLVPAGRYRGFLFAALGSLGVSVLVRSVRWKRKD